MDYTFHKCPRCGRKERLNEVTFLDSKTAICDKCHTEQHLIYTAVENMGFDMVLTNSKSKMAKTELKFRKSLGM